MKTFRAVLSQWMFLAVILCVGFMSMGAAFSPLSPSFQAPAGPMRLGPSSDPGIISGLIETKIFSFDDAASDRLEALVLTHRAISVSA